MNLWVMRHCESEGNIDLSKYRSIPNQQIRLSERGRRQAQLAAEMLFEEMLFEHASRFDMIFCSPFQRTRETSQIIKNYIMPRAEGWNASIIEDLLLSEQSYGQAMGCDSSAEFIGGREDQKSLHFIMSPLFYRFPQGECFADVALRAELFLSKLHRQVVSSGDIVNTLCYYVNILIVSHNGFCMMLDQQLKGDYSDEKRKTWQNGETHFYQLDSNMMLVKDCVLRDSLKIGETE